MVGFFLFCFLQVGFAQGKQKFAVVDLGKIIQEAEAAKEAKEKLQAEYKKRQDELKKMQDEIIRMQDELLRKSKLISQKELERRRAQIERKQQEFLAKLRLAESEMQQLDSKLTQEVLDDVRQIISDIAEKEGYDAVFEKSQILYLKDADDITYKVIDIYNKIWRERKKKRKR